MLGKCRWRRIQDYGAEQQGPSADSDALGNSDCHFRSLDFINLASRAKSRLKRLYGIDRSDPKLIVATQAGSDCIKIIIGDMPLFSFIRSLFVSKELDCRLNSRSESESELIYEFQLKWAMEFQSRWLRMLAIVPPSSLQRHQKIHPYRRK